MLFCSVFFDSCSSEYRSSFFISENVVSNEYSIAQESAEMITPCLVGCVNSEDCQTAIITVEISYTDEDVLQKSKEVEEIYKKLPGIPGNIVTENFRIQQHKR